MEVFAFPDGPAEGFRLVPPWLGWGTRRAGEMRGHHLRWPALALNGRLLY
jgi:hypothetical protein